MDRQVKQRVVGAAVLVVLGVIFIPIFLDDGAPEIEIEQVAKIPPRPQDAFESRVLPLDEADIETLDRRTGSSLDEVAEVADETARARDLQAEHSESPPPTPDTVAVVEPPASSPAPPPATAPPPPQPPAAAQRPREVAATAASTSVEAWAVQLGSFANDANAKRLIEKLRGDSYPAYLERRVEHDNTVFKVRVGPQLDRAEAEKVRAELEQKYALKGMLLRSR